MTFVSEGLTFLPLSSIAHIKSNISLLTFLFLLLAMHLTNSLPGHGSPSLHWRVPCDIAACPSPLKDLTSNTFTKSLQSPKCHFPFPLRPSLFRSCYLTQADSPASPVMKYYAYHPMSKSEDNIYMKMQTTSTNWVLQLYKKC